MMSETLSSSLAQMKSKCRIQRVFGDKLKVEEKLQVLDALISASDQKSDFGGYFHPEISSLSNQNNLIKEPQEPVNYECAVCTKNFLSLNQYYGHLQKHRGEDFSWVCSKCPEGTSVFKSLKHLRKHEKSTHLTKTHKCKFCNDTFLEPSVRDAHINKTHSELIKFSCQFCDKTFSKKSDLRMHLATHLSLQRSVCEVCGRSFSHISNLIRHSYLHTGVKPYPCKVCGKRFTQLSSLKQHKISHHGNLSIPCPASPQECGKVFRTPVHARQHAFRVHPDVSWENPIPKLINQKQQRSFYCRVCGEEFKSAKDLRDHHSLEHCVQSAKESSQNHTGMLDCDTPKLLSTLACETERQVDNLVNDVLLEAEEKNAESSAEDLIASISVECTDTFGGDVGLSSDSSTETLEPQSVLLSTAESSESFEVLLPPLVDNQTDNNFLLEDDQDSQLSKLQFLNMEDMEENHQLTGLQCLKMENGQEDVSQLSLSVDEDNGHNHVLAELQCLIDSNEDQCNQLTETPCITQEDRNEFVTQFTDLQNLTCHHETDLDCLDIQKSSDPDSELTVLQCLRMQADHGLDNDLSELECHSVQPVLEHDNQMTEFQCLDPHDNTENLESFVSDPGYFLSSDVYSSLLNEVEQKDENSSKLSMETTDSYILTMKFSDDIISLLSENNNRQEEIIVYVSEGNGTPPTEVRIKPVMTSVVACASSDTIPTAEPSLEDPFIETALGTLSEGDLSAIIDKPAPQDSLVEPDFKSLSEEVLSPIQDEPAPHGPLIETALEPSIQHESYPVTEKSVVVEPSSESLTPEKQAPEENTSEEKKKKKKPNRPKKKCPECGKMFFKTSNLTQHLGTHFPNLQGYECHICNQSFAWKSTLNRHIISVHEIVLKQLLCDICGKQYHKISQVKEHKKRDHLSLRPNTCNICNKSFFRKYDLHIHQRIHTNQKPFMCETCGKTFNHLSHVKRHESVHKGPTSYDCDTCGDSFKQKSDMKLHWRLSPACNESNLLWKKT